tara:strand:- start:33 stop:248 length:216 start_codon:yes stop_codon:yes gene_type:complete
MILTTIDGIPLYSTIQEALTYAATRGLTGYHTHTYQGTIGYMGGASHGSVTRVTRVTQQITTNTTGGSSNY